MIISGEKKMTKLEKNLQQIPDAPWKRFFLASEKPFNDLTPEQIDQMAIDLGYNDGY